MKFRSVLVPAMAGALALTVTACGGDAASEPKAAGTDGLTKVSMSVIPVANVAELYLAKKQGIFEDHGIDLDIQLVQPPAIVPSLLSGDVDFGWGSAPGLVAARGNDVPIKAVTTVAVAGDDPASFPIQVMVPKGSDITTPEDLVGKKVATDTLFQMPDLALIATLEDAGIDASKVELVEIPFANMAESLAGGQVDAVISTDPFVTIMEQSIGASPLMGVTDGLSADSPISIVIASEKFIGENADLVDEFRAAMDEATDYAKAHDDELRTSLSDFTELPPELAGVIKIAPISTVDDAAGWDAWGDLLVQVGALDQKPDSADAFLAD